MGTGLLGGMEEMVLLALRHLGQDTYGVPVRELLQERLGRKITMGSVYGTLDRLEEKGFASSAKEEVTRDPGRLGRPRRLLSITPAGLKALEDSAELRARMWAGVAPLPGGGQ